MCLELELESTFQSSFFSRSDHCPTLPTLARSTERTLGSPPMKQANKQGAERRRKWKGRESVATRRANTVTDIAPSRYSGPLSLSLSLSLKDEEREKCPCMCNVAGHAFMLRQLASDLQCYYKKTPTHPNTHARAVRMLFSSMTRRHKVAIIPALLVTYYPETLTLVVSSWILTSRQLHRHL